MPSRQSVRTTYAHKKRRMQNTSKKLISSPLEVLSLETDDLTRTQMARRMLKRSRRVALSEQSEDRSVEHIREHLAKRIKYNRERVSHIEPSKTPFSSPHAVRESAVAQLPSPEQLSPVPAAKRTASRTSSRKLKENNTLASPFSSRPGSAASSPKHKGRGRSSCRILHGSLHTKSRTLSGDFKEDARRVSRNNSVSLKDANRASHAKSIKHHRYPSSPSTSYMRSQFAQEDWFVPHNVLSRTVDHYDDAITLSGVTLHGDGSFHTGRPQFCSTPARSRPRRASDSRGRNSAGSFVADYGIPLHHSPVLTASTEALGAEGAYKPSVGEQLCNFPGTSPVHGGALIVRTCKKSTTLTSPASPNPTTVPCPPSSPASDLAQEFGSMDIGDTHSDGEMQRPTVPVLLARAHSFQDALGESATKTSVKRMPTRNRAGTIRASDFVKLGLGTSSSGGAPGPTVSLLSNVKRTRSGTVVGLDSKFATKGSSTEGAPATRLRAAQYGSEPESDDELLLKVAWMEDLEYLGLGAPVNEDVEIDELNLSGLLPG